jgi:hypothetical protein
MCLFLYQNHAGFVTVAQQCALKSGIVMPPGFLSLLKADLAIQDV